MNWSINNSDKSTKEVGKHKNYNWGSECCNIYITGVLEGKKRDDGIKIYLKGQMTDNFLKLLKDISHRFKNLYEHKT